MLAYMVRIGKMKTAIQVIDLKTMHRGWVISPDANTEEDDHGDYEALPEWSKIHDSVLSFLIYSEEDNRVAVSNLRNHPDFEKLFGESGKIENLSNIGDLKHIFDSENFKPVPTRPSL